MKRREWEWRLAGGEIIRAELDPSTGIETVWIGEKLASRSPEGGAPDGHTLSIAGTGSAYRGAGQARVVFDTFGEKLASCVLTIDEQAIAPTRAPQRFRAFAIPAVGGSVVLMVAVTAVKVIARIGATPSPPETTMAVSICEELGVVSTASAGDTPFTRQPISALPVPQPGTIADGTYVLTNANVYGTAPPATKTTRWVIRFQGEKWVSARSESPGGSGWKGGGRVAATGTVAFETVCGDIGITMGARSYTATPTAFSFQEDSRAAGTNRVVTEWVFTRQ